MLDENAGYSPWPSVLFPDAAWFRNTVWSIWGCILRRSGVIDLRRMSMYEIHFVLALVSI